MCSLFLIGSGPGDISFLSLCSLNKIYFSNIIFYDSLINLELLNFTKLLSKKILIGKRFNQSSIFKKTIYSKIFIYYKKYFFISKLKSGDINIFSRINNEILFFNNKFLNYELLPGITSFLTSLVNLKISLTFRFNISSILFITYYNNFNILKLDKSFIEKTIVYYMINNNINYVLDFIKNKNNKIYYISLLENGSFYSEHIYIFNIYDLNLEFSFNFFNNNFIKLIFLTNLIINLNLNNFFINFYIFLKYLYI